MNDKVESLNHSQNGLHNSPLSLTEYAVCYFLSVKIQRFPCSHNISAEPVNFLGNS